MIVVVHIFVVLALLACNCIVAHPTIYPHIALKHGRANRVRALPNPPPPIISYHIHITYTLFNPPVVKEALELRNRTRQRFQDYLAPDCTGRYDYGYLCMIDDHDIENTTLIGGPFVSGEWSIFVPLGDYPLITPWLTQNRGNLSLLLHPNTGYEYEDHDIWALWAGQRWPLDMSIFDKETQTNEFGHYPGDSDNPVCLSKNGVCGDDQLYTSTLCCFDLAFLHTVNSDTTQDKSLMDNLNQIDHEIAEISDNNYVFVAENDLDVGIEQELGWTMVDFTENEAEKYNAQCYSSADQHRDGDSSDEMFHTRLQLLKDYARNKTSEVRDTASKVVNGTASVVVDTASMVAGTAAKVAGGTASMVVDAASIVAVTAARVPVAVMVVLIMGAAGRRI
ncbi:unnamed protein product [Adineta steineri]|uniref:Uncharacterized protein n=1 Tax=Adineta steineri TaxID=433720 RepID=A0A818YBQ6_9BILA|nr:unnamed protein product [Adineta steineri]CAF3754039.1 unnamed protein product [Adineta steineri]